MLEKLRKAGLWLLANKERLVFLIMIGVLCYQVYKVVSPQKDDSEKESGPLPTPRAELPTPWTTGPQDPPASPPPFEKIKTDALVRTNPFTVLASSQTQDSSGIPADLGVRLVEIVPWSDGSLRAGLITNTPDVQYFAEGEAFQAYRLLKIDAQNNSVTVYSEKHGKSFVLSATG